MTDRNELINDIAELKAKRDRLLAQVKEAEQWESVAWDSYYAVADHVKALEKKQEIGRNYWESSQRAISHQFDFVADQANKVKKVLAKKRYDLLDEEIDKLMNEVRELADVLGIEIDELPLDFPFFALSAEGFLMSKTVSELSAELGVSKQYLNRVLSQNNLGRKIGNKS